MRISSNGLLFPLDSIYAHSGVTPPQAREIQPDDIPAPYRSLLIHRSAMTVTLERHSGGRVVLRPLSTFLKGRWYCRRVLLSDDNTGRPVEMGAIRIRIDAFTRKVQRQILDSQIPLGRLLHANGVHYDSRPKAFLAVTPNREMMGVFWMREPHTLYGRRTEMIHEGSKIGDIVEILPEARGDS